MFPLSEGWPELFPESIAACCSPRVLREKEGIQSLFKHILCQLPLKGNCCRGVLLYFQIFAFPHTEAQIQHSTSIFYPHKQHGPLNSVLLCMCNTKLALKILISDVFTCIYTTWGKVPQMCFSQPRSSMQEGCSRLFTQPVETHFWLASICSRADSAEVPFFPMGGPDCSREWVGIGPASCKPFMADPF